MSLAIGLNKVRAIAKAPGIFGGKIFFLTFRQKKNKLRKKGIDEIIEQAQRSMKILIQT